MKNSIILIIVLSVYSCQKKDNLGANSIENAQSNVDSAKLNKKKYLQPNDEYRKNVLPYIQIKNNQARLKSLLIKLDSHNISFCEYVKLEYKFDDSCYAVAKNKYPSPEMQKSFTNYHNSTFDKNHPKLFAKYGLTEKEADFLTTVYAFDRNSRNLCGEF